MVDNCYISHTSSCAGWDMDKLLTGFYQKACRTMRFPNNEEGYTIKMLDWDYRHAMKNFNKVWKKHIELVQIYDFDLVMSPDSLFNTDQEKVYGCYLELQDYCKRVVMPCSYYYDSFEDFELAMPLASGFNPTPKNFWLWEIQDKFTHILGGSPHQQIKMLKQLSNVKTVDGNQMFNVAVNFGKYWKEKWIKPEYQLANEVCFGMSLTNFEKSMLQSGLTISRRI